METQIWNILQLKLLKSFNKLKMRKDVFLRKLYKFKIYITNILINLYRTLFFFSDKKKDPIYSWNINIWKHQYISNLLEEKKVYFFPSTLTSKKFNKRWKQKILLNSKSEILIWGRDYPTYLDDFIKKYQIKVTFVEDGFIRSIGLGSNYELPLSLNFDSKTLYFDATKESDLEVILQTYDFKNDKSLMTRAMTIKSKLLRYGISKYNHASQVNLYNIYGKKTKKRILVVGQVEDDASIKYGCNQKINNNDLVRIAYHENPDAQIIYKPHPDVLSQRRKALSNPKDVENISLVIKDSIPISQALETIDHVYTITSQVGFEALLRDIKVTTIGLPFYAGWGLTNEKQKCLRRTRKLTIDELFAGAYILYPIYFDSKKRINIEDVLDKLV